MSAKAFQLRVPAHLVERIAELVRRTGRTPNPTAIEGAARKLLGAACQEAEICGDVSLWLDTKPE